ncbi:MAG: biotin carboxylase [Spirochaetia bacterium]|nr:biotin carboxylase [Spirochaetia bacterium]
MSSIQNTPQDRFRASSSGWVASFSCAHLNVLIVCRGPIRKETMDVFESLGAGYGILLSEKDSVSYPHTIAPELRSLTDQDRIHRIPDYAGANAEEKKLRIQQIIDIARQWNYTHIFAGYGFMAEDAEFVEEIERAGVGFMGPASPVHKQAGAKDMAKKLARKLNLSVTPGLDNISSITLLKKSGGEAGLEKVCKEHGLDFAEVKKRAGASATAEDIAEQVLDQALSKGKGLITVQDLQKEAQVQLDKLFAENKGKRFRLKYIGGGGGKGQRIVSASDQVANAVQEVLAESKTTGDADNKNFLIEANIEHTRHNEIQLLGNGDWSIALGGRDCSLQMHEQKLVELSITDELYATEIQLAESRGKKSYAETLAADRALLAKMEEQGEQFGKATGLNSASTFECIVAGNDFYFMEMNTRIQVEHRVTEMVYSLRFENPSNKNDFFIVESLVEAMALCAAHGPRLPRPIRIKRNVAGGEIRLNAQNDALQPSSGGLIEFWSPSVENEIRDDQGICEKNPDTGRFIHYYLAGAYDSNIALIVSYGESRRENLDRLADILRRMELRGSDLNTNRDFHYGILNFCLGLHPMLKPDTKFVLPYLAGVGALVKEIENVDVDSAFSIIRKRYAASFGKPGDVVVAQKLTLVPRAIEQLMLHPHLCMGWLMLNHHRSFVVEGGKVLWLRNPIFVLRDLYQYLRLDKRDNAPPSHVIWDHDHELLLRGCAFATELEKAVGLEAEASFKDSLLRSEHNEYRKFLTVDSDLRSMNASSTTAQALGRRSADLYEKTASAYVGWSAGLELLSLVVQLGVRSRVLEFGVDDHLQPTAPDIFHTAESQKQLMRALAPPPKAAADQIVAVTGGMFYAQEAPTSPQFLSAGQHFQKGDPIYIIEVMKMFNKIYAEFAGTVEDILVKGSGTVVRKGQPLFRVKPDEEIHLETDAERNARRKKRTEEVLATI